MNSDTFYRKAPIINSPPPRTFINDPPSKISPAFNNLLREKAAPPKQPALLLHRNPEVTMNTRGNPRDLNVRRAMLAESAEAFQPIRRRIIEQYAHRAAQEKVREIPNFRFVGGSVFPIAGVDVTRENLPILAGIPEVEAIIPDVEMELIAPVESVRSMPDQSEINAGMTWGLEILEIPKMWEITKGEGINVAVLDSGAYGAHPALVDKIQAFACIDSYGNFFQSETSFDFDGHGTHVCGTISGRKLENNIAFGVAPATSLNVAFKSSYGTFSSTIAGLAWSVENNSYIVNMSYGATRNSYEIALLPVLGKLISEYDIIPVAAIGNEGYGRAGFPGISSSIFSVGAVQYAPSTLLGVEVTDFSGGATIIFPEEENLNTIIKPDVVAPGKYVYSCVPFFKGSDVRNGFGYMNGTSMAAPHVAGVAALLMAAHPNAPAAEIMNALRETAKHPFGKRPDNRWGYGLIQPLAAHEALK